VKSGTIFDNIFVGDSLEEAKKFAEDTWGATKEAEKAAIDKVKEEEKAAAAAAAEAAGGDDDMDDMDDEYDDMDDDEKDEL